MLKELLTAQDPSVEEIALALKPMRHSLAICRPTIRTTKPYVVKVHPLVLEGDARVLRGLLAHERGHLRLYERGGAGQVLHHLNLYSVGQFFNKEGLRRLETAIDLGAIIAGEGVSLAAFKRFRKAKVNEGLISRRSGGNYLSPEQTLYFTDNPSEARAYLRELSARHDYEALLLA
ncbi:hypothetical protein D6789_00750 [Candidatus Woesearchaeota archaeon]|nr:MAG: hypothetical protein D6789_00750 [Candidatus Woesearchaeota archaeon]